MIHLTFEREPGGGGVLRGDVRIRDGPPPRSAVVIVHGFRGFKDWGFFPWVARRLAAEGHAAVSFNFSGAGVGGDASTFTDLEAFAANTLTRELRELERIVDWVRSGDLLPTKPASLGLLGHSRGGADAILHAGRRGDVDALVTWSAVATFDRWSEATRREWRRRGRIHVLDARTGQQMPLDVELLRDFEENRERLDVVGAARRVSLPWLIVHGRDDLTVREEEARTLARESPDARLVLVEKAGHTYEVGHPFEEPSPQLREVMSATVRHFRRHLS